MCATNERDSSVRQLDADLRKLIEVDPTVVPDYSPEAISTLSSQIPVLRKKLNAIDHTGFDRSDEVDCRLVAAQINALDFFVRVLQPYARDPNFYLSVFVDQSDTPEHEGIYATTIDLWRFDYPLSASDAERLKKMLITVPALLEQAQNNLSNSNARDLFTFGVRAFREQAANLNALADGTLVMNSLDGQRQVDMSGMEPQLRSAIESASLASSNFANWIEAEAPKRTGPSGIGKDEYSWAAKNVFLLPYDWDAQVVLLKRELDRSWASLSLEEARNRTVPPIQPTEDASTHNAAWNERTERLSSFLIDRGFVTDQPFYRKAIPSQQLSWAPLETRDFFRHIVALEPLALQTHFYHWIELARKAHEPHPRTIRKRAPVLNVWQERSEGVATAMEELTLQTGLYDDLNPHARELVWIMLANRAARGLAALYVQANLMTLEEAGQFHAAWTPRAYSDPSSPLVAFEQLLYLRQPGYGASYILGKLQVDGLLSKLAKRATDAGQAFDACAGVKQIIETGFLPLSLIEYELLGETQH